MEGVDPRSLAATIPVRPVEAVLFARRRSASLRIVLSNSTIRANRDVHGVLRG
jgi:hypothetical protein